MGIDRRVSDSTREHKPAFTLIEVLVVAGIIALLAAILLPSLQQARDQAKAVLCCNNLKQCLAGIKIHKIERGIQKERISTNFGWAVPTFRANGGQAGIFTCPGDPDPKPIPALFVEVVPGHGTTASDGIFNRWKRPITSANDWRLDVQDVVDAGGFGLDAQDASDVDLELAYPARPGEKSTPVRVARHHAALGHNVLNWKGQSIWRDAQGGEGPVTMPLLWMSYGANAAAGLRSTKGNPAVLLESTKPGVFPEQLGPYPADSTLGKPLRFRHGERSTDPALSGYDYSAWFQWVTSTKPDSLYQPRQRMNVGFLDGHAQSMHYREVIRNPASAFWLGSGRGADRVFD